MKKERWISSTVAIGILLAIVSFFIKGSFGLIGLTLVVITFLGLVYA